MSLLFFGMLMASAAYSGASIVGDYKNSLEDRREQARKNDPVSTEICDFYKKEWNRRYGDGNGGYSTLVGVGVAAQAVKLAVKLSKMSDEEKKDYLEYIRFRGIEIL